MLILPPRELELLPQLGGLERYKRIDGGAGSHAYHLFRSAGGEWFQAARFLGPERRFYQLQRQNAITGNSVTAY
ncbi:MAG: hypothetical protein V3V55_00690 [Rhodospirillales bacterium]